MNKKLKITTWAGGSVVILALFFYILCLNHTSVNEIGVSYNSLNGEMAIQKTPGWYLTNPFVKVAYISTLPTKVTITSSAAVIVTKIVRFKPEGLAEFIRLQGFSYSINSGFENIMLGYAFSGNTYSFLEIIQESTVENASDARPIVIKGQPAPTPKDTTKIK